MEPIRNRLIALILLIINFIISILVISQIMMQQKLQNQQSAMQLLANTANTIDHQLSMSLSSTKALASLIQQYGDIEDFNSLAEQMLKVYGGIKCLQLAPNGIITKCYPLEGNESVIGGNLLTSTKRKTESFKAIQDEKLTLAGPFELSQGGTGTIGRFPVFINKSENLKKFWGFTIAIISLPEFLKYTGIDKLEKSGYDYWLWRINPDTRLVEVFASTSKNFDKKNSMSFNIEVPNSVWTLSAMPKNGWINRNTRMIWYMSLFLLSIFIAVVVYLWLQRNTLLKQKSEFLKINEQKLLEVNASKDKFFSIIAHDLRGPVGTLVSICQVIEEKYAELKEEERIHYISYIRSGSEKTLSLIDNLLLWAKNQKNTLTWKPTGFEINQVIGEVIELFETTATDKNQRIIFESTNQIYVFADKEMLTTVVRNLISNAIKFTPRNGLINIKSYLLDNSICKVEVCDTGVGIDKEKLHTLFQLENVQSTVGTENESGTGLGLVLCKEFVEKNNGKIEVESLSAKGTCFSFTIPLTDENH
ncbi:MAG: ATP-binding protein [Bacteroidales bacterium]